MIAKLHIFVMNKTGIEKVYSKKDTITFNTMNELETLKHDIKSEVAGITGRKYSEVLINTSIKD